MNKNNKMEGSSQGPSLVKDDRLPTSVEEAEKVLDDIRTDRGFLRSEYEEDLSCTRLELQDAFRKLAEIARRTTVKYMNRYVQHTSQGES